MERKILPSYRGLGNMEGYGSGSQVLQGQPAYQVIRKPIVMPQVQQSIRSNASLPKLVLSGYQCPQASNIVNYSGVNRPVEPGDTKTTNEVNYIAQGVDNTSKVLFWIHNPACRNNNPNLNCGQGNNQSDKLQNLQVTKQGMNTPSIATSANQKMFGNPNPGKSHSKNLIKVSEPVHVNLNTYVSEKVGSLKIHISESFLPWSITNKTILDLDFMRHLFNISGIDVILNDKKRYDKGMKAAILQLLQNKILSDWLVLKCEEKEIPFLKVNSQVEIYTASNFTALLNVVSQESCLPLPFFIEENNFIKYLYLNFPKTGNDRVKKLNVPIFHVADIGKKKLPCKYPGIRVDCDYENASEGFVIHVHESALTAYETSLVEIRQHIIYQHIIWGFLQMWIKLVKKEYNQCFKFDDIAKNLCLCRAELSADGKTRGMENGLIYDIGFMNCYLKFDPVTLKESKASFSMDNFSTNVVCNLSIVQYYKQYFLINDMHFSDALRNTVIFFRHCYDKKVKTGNYVGVPTRRLVPIQPKNSFASQQELKGLPKGTSNSATSANLSANTSAVNVSCTSEVRSNKNDAAPVELEHTVPTPVLVKPLLKTRTVEEINSLVDSIKKTGVNNNTEALDISEVICSKQKNNTRPLNYTSFVSLVLKFVENCYAANSPALSVIDESNEKEVIDRRFDEAVRIAVGMDTVEAFIGKIYVHLQLHFTNPTCQNILNERIWKAIEIKYPDLKELVSENIAKSLKEKSLTSGTDSQNKNRHLSNSTLNDQLNVFGHGGKGGCADNNNFTTVSMTLESENTTSDSEVETDTVESDKAESGDSEEREVDSRSASSTGVSLREVNQTQSNVTSANGQPNEGNVCIPASPACENLWRKDEDPNKKKREKQSLPYTNTLTFVRVSTNPATFRISKKPKKNSATQSSGVEKNESYNTSKTHSTVSSNKSCSTSKKLLTMAPNESCTTLKTNPTVNSNESCRTPKNLPTVGSNERFSTPKTHPTVASNETGSTPKTLSTVASNESCSTPKKIPPVTSNERFSTPKTHPTVALNEMGSTPKTLSTVASNKSCSTPKKIPPVTSNERFSTPKTNPTMASNKSCSTPKNLPPVTSNERCSTPKTNPTMASNKSCSTPKNLPPVTSNERCSTPKTNPTMASNRSCSTPKNLPPVTSNEILDTDKIPAEEREQYVHTVEKGAEVDKEYPGYKLKPCSVVLNSKDVETYMRRYRKRKRKESSYGETDMEEDEDYVPGRVRRKLCVEDSDDEDFVMERKKLKRKVSEIQYMEARTRVLQRLRKRKSLYVGYEGARISGDELDNFFVRRRSSSSKLSNYEGAEEASEDEHEVEKEDSEIDKCQLNGVTQMEEEPEMKEVRVVLVRLEDTPEYEKYRDKILRNEKQKPAMDYLNREHFPRMRQKYFEIREGKLYLKDEYHVKNGAIVRRDEGCDPVKPKSEPESSVNENDFSTYDIKTEIMPD